MSKKKISMPILLIMLFAAGIPPLYAQQQAATPLKEIGDLLVGRWMSETVWAVDYPGIGKKGEKSTGYQVCRWIADQAAIECEMLTGKTSNKSLYWWDAGSKQLRSVRVDSGGNWSEGTVSKQGAKLTGAVSGAFADGRRVQFEFEHAFQDGGNTIISTGATILNGVRNPWRDTLRRVAK